jgi:hypothetical protein
MHEDELGAIGEGPKENPPSIIGGIWKEHGIMLAGASETMP